MSQFALTGGSFGRPGSDLERGAYADRTKRLPSGITHSPELGIQGTLNTTGLVTPPPEISDGAKLASDLAASLGVVGHLANQIYTYDQHDAAAQERMRVRDEIAQEKAQREADRIKAHEDALLKGHGAFAYRTDVAKVASDIENGRLAVPIDDTGVDKLANALVQQHTDGMDPVAAEAYREHALPHFTSLLVAKRDANAKLATEHGLSLIADRAISATSADEINKAVADAKANYPNIDEDTILAKVAFPAMQAAADAGDAARFSEAQKVLGDRFKADQLKQELHLGRTLDARQRQTNDDFRNAVGEMDIQGIPYDERMKTLRKDWGDRVPASLLDSQLKGIQRQKDAAEKDALKQASDLYEASAMPKAVSLIGPALDAGDVYTGAAALRDVTLTRPDGKEFTLKAKDIAEAARDQKFAEFDKQYTDPQANLAAKVGWLAKNPTLSDPAMASAWAGASGRITADGEIQPSLLQGYDLFKRSFAMNPSVAQGAIKNSADHEFLRVAQIIEENVDGMGPAEALRAAKSAITKDPMGFSHSYETVTRDAVLKAARSVTGSKNDVTAAEAIATRARAYAILGQSPEDAIRQATKHFKQDYTKINGFWVNTRGRPVAKAIDTDAVTSAVVGSYLKSNPSESSPNAAKTFTLRPDANAGGWTVATHLGQPGRGTPVLSDADVQFIDSYIKRPSILAEQADREKAIADTVKQSSINRVGGIYHRTYAARSGVAYTNADYRDVTNTGRGYDLSKIDFSATEPKTPDPIPEAPVPPHLQSIIDFINEGRIKPTSQPKPSVDYSQEKGYIG